VLADQKHALTLIWTQSAWPHTFAFQPQPICLGLRHFFRSLTPAPPATSSPPRAPTRRTACGSGYIPKESTACS
jgi:hypothetical protein